MIDAPGSMPPGTVGGTWRDASICKCCGMACGSVDSLFCNAGDKMCCTGECILIAASACMTLCTIGGILLDALGGVTFGTACEQVLGAPACDVMVDSAGELGSCRTASRAD